MRRTRIERLLPPAFQAAARPGSVLFALLDVMEGMTEPADRRIGTVDELFCPYRTPEAFLPFLLGWVAMDHIGRSLPPHRQRDLIARAGELARVRGTAGGLCRLLETVTGQPGFSIAEPAGRPFHIVVRVPDGARGQLHLIRLVVAAEKPAAVTAAIEQSE